MENKWKDNTLSREIIALIEKYPSIVIYDTETTGLSKKKDQIIQFSAIRYKLPDFEEMDRLDIYIKCPFSVPEEASKVNKITDEVLEDLGLTEKEAFTRITEFLRPDDLIGGYNNKSFDDKFMEVLYHRYKQEFIFADNIDVFKYAKSIIPPEKVMAPTEVKNKTTGNIELVDKPCYKLENIASYLDGGEYQFHSSIEDVAATGNVLIGLLDLSRELIWFEEEEEAARKSVPRQDAKVATVSLYAPSQNLKRVYVNTDQGTIYYDEIKHRWGAKTGNVDSLNMVNILKQVYELSGATSELDLFSKMQKKEKVSLQLNIKRQKIVWKIFSLVFEEMSEDKMEEAFRTYEANLKKAHLYDKELLSRLIEDNLISLRNHTKGMDEESLLKEIRILKKESRSEDWELKASEDIEELYQKLKC